MSSKRESPGSKTTTDREQFTLSVVVPAYNEAPNLAALCEVLLPIVSQFSQYEVIFVDDGSSDETLSVLQDLNCSNRHIHFLSLTRNFGHQLALKAGMDHARGDCVVTMDGDLQHPPELIPSMVRAWQDGADIVSMIRRDDPRLPWSKRMTSHLFYRLLNRLSEVEVRPGAADFRLLDRRALRVLQQCSERTLFLRGLVSWLGFRTVELPYEPAERHAGFTKYSAARMLRFSIDGICSFSTRPLQIAVPVGLVSFVMAAVLAAFILYASVTGDRAVPHWAPTTVMMLLVGGFELLCIGILGTYIGMLTLNMQARPLYIVRVSDSDES